MKARRLIAETAVITAGTLFWLALTAVIGLPMRDRPERAEAAATQAREASRESRRSRNSFPPRRIFAGVSSLWSAMGR